MVFFLYTKHVRRRAADGPETLWGNKKGGAIACTVSSHTQWRNRGWRQGALRGERIAAGRFPPMDAVWPERFFPGTAVDTVPGTHWGGASG